MNISVIYVDTHLQQLPCNEVCKFQQLHCRLSPKTRTSSAPASINIFSQKTLIPVVQQLHGVDWCAFIFQSMRACCILRFSGMRAVHLFQPQAQAYTYATLKKLLSLALTQILTKSSKRKATTLTAVRWSQTRETTRGPLAPDWRSAGIFLNKFCLIHAYNIEPRATLLVPVFNIVKQNSI